MDELKISNDTTPDDLYALLNVDSSISDRVLEAKILSMINQYKTAKATTSGNDDEYDQVINFMIDVYKYFFEDADADDDGVGDNRERALKKYDDETADFKFDSDSTIRDLNNNDINNNKDLTAKVGENDITNERAGTVTINNQNPREFTLDGGTTGVPTINRKDRRNEDEDEDKSASTFTFSYPLQYAIQDGQIINQATKRIVSINSGSRYNPAGTTSSSFTLNLSETLKNVVKLKLYSVSIPYSWYTISEDYGSNFFYIKGNSPGIYNETHDIKIQIEPGNYTSGTLIEKLSSAIKSLKGIVAEDNYITENNLHIPDVSLNNTDIRYNSNSGKTKFFIGIKKNYDSNYFRVRFPYITPVYSDSGTKERNNDLSIPSFLGFTTETLNSYTVRSDLSGNDPTVTLDESNDTIKILRYRNDNNTFDGTNVLKIIDLSFNYGVETDISSNKINDKLTDNVDINKASEYVIDNSGNYLKLKLERDDSINNLNTKVIILFPFNKANMTNIWTDELKFQTDGMTTYLDISYNYKILNDVFSQEPAVNDRILVPSSRSIKMEFIPTKPLYNGLDINGDVLTSDVSLNKFELVIPTKDSGYTNDEFITAINTGFDNINATFTDNHNTKIFNKTSNENIMRLDNNELKLDIDISYNLGISNYLLDLSGTIMGRLLGIESEYHDYDLSNNSVLNDDITINGDIITITKSGWTQKTEGYFLSGTVNATATPFVLKLKPKQDGPVRNLPVINVPPHPRYYVDGNIDGIFVTYELGGISGFAELINDSLKEYSNPSFNNTNLLGDCSFSTEVVDAGASTARFDLSLNISDYLDERNYKLVLTDTDSDVWTNRFYLNATPYDLSANPHIISIDSKTIDKDVIEINDENSQIIIEPLPVNIDGGSNGVFDTLNRNTIYINIPYDSYTRNELINKINSLLKTTYIASGKILSKDMSFIIKDDDYCLIDFNLNRMFQARDFKVVFFDSTFSNCKLGSTSIQNTTYDSTIGYILGYRDKTEYPLGNVIDSARVDVKQFISKQQLNVNLYNEFSIVLDDYNNNRLPSAIVSGIPPSSDFEIPTYAKRAASSCDEDGNLLLSLKDKNNNNLTAKQLSAIYSNIETAQAKQTDIFRANQKVIAKDVFAVIPLNVAGLTAGELFVKEGLTLQEQTRSYFGPVDIQRISVKILTDKGTLVNLNQDEWSFSFVCEQIHDQTLGQYIKDSKGDGFPNIIV